MELDELDGTVGVRPVAEAAAVELQDGGPGGGREGMQKTCQHISRAVAGVDMKDISVNATHSYQGGKKNVRRLLAHKGWTQSERGGTGSSAVNFIVEVWEPTRCASS